MALLKQSLLPDQQAATPSNDIILLALQIIGVTQVQ